MKVKHLVASCIMMLACVFTLNAQENLNLTAPSISPAPLDPVEYGGTGCYDFKIQNVNLPGYPNAGDTEIFIEMDNITPPNGLADLSSSQGAGAYTWSYDAATNTYSGVQSGPIGFLYSETITVCFDVTTNSFCPVEENGFTATGTIINGDDGNVTDNVASSYTCTCPVIEAGPDQVICEGETVNIGGSPTVTGAPAGATITWTPDATIDDPSIENPNATPTVTTTYTVTVSTGFGCLSSDEVTVVVNPLPTPDAGTYGPLCIDNGLEPLVGWI